MQFEVQTSDGGPISPRRGLVRCVGLFLAALPLFLGFVPILYDDRRRGFQDRFAGTVVVNAPAVSMIEARRARKREQYLAASRRDAETEVTMGTQLLERGVPQSSPSSSIRSAMMIRAAASSRARCENACGKFPRCRPVLVSNSSA